MNICTFIMHWRCEHKECRHIPNALTLGAINGNQ
jgi:hypothetical protein